MPCSVELIWISYLQAPRATLVLLLSPRHSGMQEQRERKGRQKEENSEIKFYLLKPAMDACVLVFSDTGSQLSEADQHVTNFNI